MVKDEIRLPDSLTIKNAAGSSTNSSTPAGATPLRVCRHKWYDAKKMVFKGGAGTTEVATAPAHEEATRDNTRELYCCHIFHSSIAPPPTSTNNSTGPAFPPFGGVNTIGNTVAITASVPRIPTTTNSHGIKEHRKDAPRFYAFIRSKVFPFTTFATEPPGSPIKFPVSTTCSPVNTPVGYVTTPSTALTTPTMVSSGFVSNGLTIPAVASPGPPTNTSEATAVPT